MLFRLARYAFPLAVATTLSAVGCGGTAGSEQAATASEAVTRAPVAQYAHGRIRVLGAALGEVPLTSSQRAAIEKLAADAETRHAEARTAQQELMLTLASQVEAGTVDRAALTPKVDVLAAALGKTQPGDRAAFEQLHAILAPDQRAAFVDAVRGQVRSRFAEMRGKHPMRQWADDLQLSDDQRAQIKASMASMPGSAAARAEREDAPAIWRMKRGAKLLDTFKQDRFVMDEVAPPLDVEKTAARMGNHLIDMAEHAVPVLTAGQRSLAAQKLRERAAAGEETLP